MPASSRQNPVREPRTYKEGDSTIKAISSSGQPKKKNSQRWRRTVYPLSRWRDEPPKTASQAMYARVLPGIFAAVLFIAYSLFLDYKFGQNYDGVLLIFVWLAIIFSSLALVIISLYLLKIGFLIILILALKFIDRKQKTESK